MIIKGDPYDYRFDGDLWPANTVLIVIDMQIRFLWSGPKTARSPPPRVRQLI